MVEDVGGRHRQASSNDLGPLIVVRRLVAGVLAGASVVAAAVFALALVLLSSGLVGSIYTLSSRIYGDLSVGEAFRVTLLLAYGVFIFLLREGRWALPGLCLLGFLLALADVNTQRIHVRGRFHLGLAVTLGVLAAVVFWFEYARYEEPLLLLGVVISLVGAWTLWACWVPCYFLWVIWLRAFSPRYYGPAIAPPIAKSFLQAQARIAWLKRKTAPGEEDPFRTPVEQIILPDEGQATGGVLIAWIGMTVLLVLVFSALLQTIPRPLIAPLIGLIAGAWFGLGALVLIDGLISMNWVDASIEEPTPP